MSCFSNKPLFPSLLPRVSDPLWHKVDAPRDEEAELTRLENERQQWIKQVSDKYHDVPPIGKTSSQEPIDDEEEEEEDDDDDNDNDNGESDSHEEEDDDVEMDLNLALESPDT